MSTSYKPRRANSALGDSSDVSSSVNDSARKRQSKKDEAIRRKIEQELSKKKRSSPRYTRQSTRKQVQGTVSSLRMSPAHTVRENITVLEASQLMAAKRSDCVLVVDDDDHLCGIFTAKDLAFRSVAEGLDSRGTPVSTIMTKNPLCVTTDASSTEALSTMVQRGFRHLPVTNEEGDVVGLLDITKCLYQAVDKMERAFNTSSKFYDALEGVQSEWSSSGLPFLQYMEALREKMSCPDVSSVLDGVQPAEVGVRTSVREAAKLMKSVHKTAVLVMEGNNIAGIFTSKDIVLRVIAAGLDPATCSVVRVMTPHPDTITPTTTILDALKKMHDGHYLNLPVLEGDTNQVVGVVNVLQLTYATLEEINSIEGQDENNGPMWNRFWQSFVPDGSETASVVSDSIAPSHSASNLHGMTPSNVSRNSYSQYPESPNSSRPFTPDNTYPLSEVHPHESASAVGNNEENSSIVNSNQQNDTTFTFKFKSPSGKVHRFVSEANNLGNIREIVKAKLVTERFNLEELAASMSIAPGTNNEDDWLVLSYLDDENDHVLITSDMDLLDSVHVAKRQGSDRVLLFLHDHTVQNQSGTAEPAVSQASQLVSSESGNNSPEVEPVPSDIEISSQKKESKVPEYNLPIPQELLLPGAIVTLAATILGVFIVNRLSR
ncbi:uncharacterized protein VTP21DRAFT_11064 [Calcarisporiella thermophila]|uniref:uncharacterized protein n=1 Tax=Calcarisporiella thermophila TaxID=911321 RepID=UPI00374455D8